MNLNAAKNILLLGGGYTLTRLAESLPRERFVITATSSEKVLAFERAGAAAAAVRIDDLDSLEAVFEQFPEIDTVIDSAPPRNANAARDEAFAVGSFLRTRGVKRLVYLSSTGVFGETLGGWVDEETPLMPQYPGAAARRDAEEGYLHSGIAGCALRLSGIYGPGRGVGHALAAGRYALVDDGKRFTNRIHVDDIVQILVRIVERSPDERLPNVLCASDDEPAPAKDVTEFYCAKFGLPPPEYISLEQARASGMVHALGNQRVSNRRLKQYLGLTLRYPSYREGAGSEF